jgi:hypothetical protein
MAEFEVPEKPEGHKERIVGLIIAAIAVILAVVSAIGHHTQNEEILAHVDGSDQYAFFQAKKERSFALELSADALQLNLDRLSPAAQPHAAQLLAAYGKQHAKLDGEGKEIEARGKEFMDEAARLSHKARVLDLGEIALQISIVLCSITILTEQRLFVGLGVITAGIGIVVSLWGIVVG